MIKIDDPIIRKVCYIFFYFSVSQGFFQRVVIHELVSGEVQEDNALLHLRERFRVYHFAGTVSRRNMDADIITFRIQILEVVHNTDRGGKAEGRFDTEERVIADYIHSQIFSGVGNHGADGAQSDNAQRFSLQLGSGKLAFSFFNGFSDAFGSG